MSVTDSDSRVAQFLLDHPRIMEVLLTLLLLTQVGLAAAGGTGGSTGGP